MSDTKEMLRQARRQFAPPESVMDGLIRRRDRKRRNQRIAAGVVAIAVFVAPFVLFASLSSSDRTQTPAASPERTADEVATGFLENYGAFDVERAVIYLAEDADITPLVNSMGSEGLGGTLEEFRLFISLLEAQGYKQMLNSCEELGSSASGTTVRCTFDYHAIGSNEIGLGPFSGSSFLFTVRDGEIVRASKTFATAEFSPQVWEPFASWVSTAYPEDAAAMYEDESYSGARLSEESIRLWERRSREYGDGRRIVRAVPFSFSVPSSGWHAGPIERLPDETTPQSSGFLSGSLYISKSTVGPQGAEAIVFWSSFPDGDFADPCAHLGGSDYRAARRPSAAALAAAVATAPGTELVTGPSDVTVGGHLAKHVVLTVREDLGCDPGYFYIWQDERWGPFWPGTNVGDTIRVWIVDVDGTLLFIEAETTPQAGPGLEQEIRQIVESIRFD